MARPARITPFRNDIQVVLDRHLSPQARSRAFASFARAKLKEADATNTRALGYTPDHETYVDGVGGASEDKVKPDGTILYTFDINLLNDALAWIGEQLVLHAPVLTGEFRKSFLFFADAEQVEMGADLPEASEYVFLNAQPYARKIERGYSDQAPAGVFEVVAKLAKARFGNSAFIRFSYRALHEGGIMPYQPVPREIVRGKNGRFLPTGRDRTAQKRERSLRTPAIVVVPR